MFHYVSRKLLVWGLSFPASNNFILFAELPTVRASKDTHYTFWFQYVYSNTMGHFAPAVVFSEEQ